MTTSSRQQRVMLLIDADNVSSDVIEQAIDRVLVEHGAAHVRRAYCTPEAALKQLALFKRLSIRPMVNLAQGKNCTDIALAIDAMDLVAAERPDVVVLVSSDSDFAPLVVRLREKGCRVCGIGQEGKTGEETRQPYDEYVELPHRKPGATAPAKTRGRGRSAAAAAPAPRPAEPPAPPSPQRVEPPPARKTRGRRAAAPAAQAPLPEDLRRVVEALPELLDGRPIELRVATQRLRQSGLLAKTAPSTRLFKKYPEAFALTPEHQPNEVQWRMGQSRP